MAGTPVEQDFSPVQRSRRNATGLKTCAAGAIAIVLALTAPRAATPPNASTRFSDLADVTPANVGRLQVAWTFHSGEFPGGSAAPTRQVPSMQSRPLLVGDLLIVTTTTSKVIAIDAEKGVEKWRFDPFAGMTRTCEEPVRGTAVWEERGAGGAVAGRTVFSGTCDGRLVALDAVTGRPRAGFASNGILDLRSGADARTGEAYALTSPAAIYKDLVIVGAMCPEETSQGPSGDVRAFDVRTGRQVWRFHTVPQPGEFGHDTWPEGAWQRRTGVNVWTSMAVDEERGLVFLPIGSASYDFYGADRTGTTLFANSLVALDAATGVRRWHFQLVHHDVWDYDPPSQPILADITRDGVAIPAVIQLTKMGLVFAFDRTNGRPVYGIEERPVPQTDVPGEHTSATQPFPVKPLPLARTTPVRAEELTKVTDASRKACEALFASVKSGGIFTPPGKDLTAWFPGTLGGATWSGGSVDPRLQYLFVNTNEVGAVGRMELTPGAPTPFRRNSPTGGAYARFWDKDQLPCQAPPWGRLNAIDLATGDIAWQVPLGDEPQLAAKGITGLGTLNLGGSVTTGGGLVFIAATNDAHIRAFEARTGRMAWQAALPASGHATPLVYRGPHSGRQFIAISASGGGKFSHTVSDTVVAFALP